MLLPSFTPRAVGIEIQAHSIGIALLRKKRQSAEIIATNHITFPAEEQTMLDQPELLEKNLAKALAQFGRHTTSSLCCVVNIPAAHTFYERILLPNNVGTSADIANYAHEQADHLLPLPAAQRLDDAAHIPATREVAIIGTALTWLAHVQEILARLNLICVASEPDIIAFHHALETYLPAVGIVFALAPLDDQFLLMAADQHAPLAFILLKKDPAEVLLRINDLIRFVEAQRTVTPALLLLALPATDAQTLSDGLKQLPMPKQVVSPSSLLAPERSPAISPILFGLARRGLDFRSFFMNGRS